MCATDPHALPPFASDVKAGPEPAATAPARLGCFGRRLDRRQVGCLMLCGLWVALAHLRLADVLPLPLPW
jgi:hypothetical protein